MSFTIQKYPHGKNKQKLKFKEYSKELVMQWQIHALEICSEYGN